MARVAVTPAARLLAEHRAGLLEQKVLLPSWSEVGEDAVAVVYERGVAACPAGQDPAAWAGLRVKAFLTLALGVRVPGYVRDLDLLAPEHPSQAYAPA